MPRALFSELQRIPYLQGYAFEPEYAPDTGELRGFALTPTDRTLRKAANLLRLLPGDMRGTRFLDIGCNKGFFCFEALRRGADAVVGIDVLDDVIPLLQRIADSSRCFANLSFQRRAFSPQVLDLGVFDVVMFCSAYHYVYAEMKSHHAIFELLARLEPARVVLELPLELDDEFARDVVRKRCAGEALLAYNHHAILHAAAQHFGSVRYVANSGFLRTRDIFVLERAGLSERFDCEWEGEPAPWGRVRSEALPRV